LGGGLSATPYEKGTNSGGSEVAVGENRFG
jgi:hypothetical protein